MRICKTLERKVKIILSLHFQKVEIILEYETEGVGFQGLADTQTSPA